jgi:hypothetical protein
MFASRTYTDVLSTGRPIGGILPLSPGRTAANVATTVHSVGP